MKCGVRANLYFRATILVIGHQTSEAGAILSSAASPMSSTECRSSAYLARFRTEIDERWMNFALSFSSDHPRQDDARCSDLEK